MEEKRYTVTATVGQLYYYSVLATSKGEAIEKVKRGKYDKAINTRETTPRYEVT